MSSSLTQQDLDNVVTIERVGSVFSLLGCLFVLVTFSCSSAFRQRAINRMVFFATFGNMLTNIATLMTRSYTSDVDSFGCQLQGFLIQVFMQSDAYWATAMAINVYLTFYHKFDARALRRMELTYWAVCYGIPFVPGFTFIFVSTQSQGRPYGNAVLWCWLKPQWEIYRIATFYGPVWIAIVITMAIYIRAGREIYKKRRKMLKFGSNMSNARTNTSAGRPDEPMSPMQDVFAPGFRTTEVVQTTEIVQQTGTGAAIITAEPGPPKDPNNVSYSVTISADAQANDNDSLSGIDLDGEEIVDHDIEAAAAAASLDKEQQRTDSSIQVPANPVANLQARRRFQRTMDAHNATWSYAKCAVLFFAALLITWMPSSGNRVYSMVNGGAISKPLFYASAFVLPLQGFWNAIIYMVTSWSACKSFWETVVSIVWRSGSRRPIIEITSVGRSRDTRPIGSKWGKGEETTSMEDLTGSSRTLRIPDRTANPMMI
ncbi:hypothetical protein B0T18DRAFT_333868 [Schizothecium vesticola]|uniref:G-protein coupled receptors family 2 profile 2 domain-containing protein n=1 Tax=Schizothecium vesticola TaxID=314040 RepID=A0AA40BPK0_9PEZI|nr:hypothetical protein B0T18DRAFT_333868 [Schizothecium vesticola]